MSTDALALKKEQARYSIELSPDSIEFDVLGLLDAVVISLPGLLDNSILGENARRMGANQFHKRRIILYMWTGYMSYITPGVTSVSANGVKYKVREVINDKSESSYVSALWLV